MIWFMLELSISKFGSTSLIRQGIWKIKLVLLDSCWIFLPAWLRDPKLSSLEFILQPQGINVWYSTSAWQALNCFSWFWIKNPSSHFSSQFDPKIFNEVLGISHRQIALLVRITWIQMMTTFSVSDDKESVDETRYTGYVTYGVESTNGFIAINGIKGFNVARGFETQVSHLTIVK